MDCERHYFEDDIRENHLYFNQIVFRVVHVRDHLIVEQVYLPQVCYSVSVNDLGIPLHWRQRLAVIIVLRLELAEIPQWFVWQILQHNDAALFEAYEACSQHFLLLFFFLFFWFRLLLALCREP